MSDTSVTTQVDEAQRVILGRGVGGAIDDAVEWAVRAVAYRVCTVYRTAVAEAVVQPIELAVYAAVNEAVVADEARKRTARFERAER